MNNKLSGIITVEKDDKLFEYLVTNYDYLTQCGYFEKTINPADESITYTPTNKGLEALREAKMETQNDR